MHLISRHIIFIALLATAAASFVLEKRPTAVEYGLDERGPSSDELGPITECVAAFVDGYLSANMAFNVGVTTALAARFHVALASCTETSLSDLPELDLPLPAPYFPPLMSYFTRNPRPGSAQRQWTYGASSSDMLHAFESQGLNRPGGGSSALLGRGLRRFTRHSKGFKTIASSVLFGGQEITKDNYRTINCMFEHVQDGSQIKDRSLCLYNARTLGSHVMEILNVEQRGVSSQLLLTGFTGAVCDYQEVYGLFSHVSVGIIDGRGRTRSLRRSEYLSAVNP
ncbi:hypothetical protein EDB87DRAFT_1581231 [Lactarius vividus]|nr:hypothetical protein EDB87DRAFT_1581231 [Lactarius vividus]